MSGSDKEVGMPMAPVPAVESKEVTEVKAGWGCKLILASDSPLLSLRTLEFKAEVKEVEQLLQHVANGEQTEAEMLIKNKPDLLLCKGNMTDLSKREFKEITAFQYALWAGDWRMYRMLLKYMLKDQAALQLVELETRGTAHGHHFSLAPLIGALRTYASNYDRWDFQKCKTHWCKEVGGIQVSLPAHVVNEYCHPSRSFDRCPVFTEEELPRSMKLYGEQGSWFTSEYVWGGYWLMGVVRSSMSVATRSIAKGTCSFLDSVALQSLSKMCQLQLDKLESELTMSNSLSVGKK